MRIVLVALFMLFGVSYAQVDPNGTLSLDEKLTFFQQKLEKLPEGEQFLEQRITVLSDIGKSYLHAKKYRSALIYLLKAKNLNPSDNPKWGVYYTAFGQLFAEIGAYDAAIQYEKRIYFNRKSQLDKYYSASSIAIFFKLLNKSDSAQFYFDYQLNAAKKLDDYVAIASALNNKGLTFLDVGEYSKALVFLNKARSQMLHNLHRRSHSFEGEKKEFVHIIEENLGRCYLKTGDYPRAAFFLENARNNLQFKSITKNDEALLLAYLKSSQPQKAIALLKDLSKLLDLGNNGQCYLWYRINLVFSVETSASNVKFWLNKFMQSQELYFREKSLNSYKTSQLISVYLLNETKTVIRNEKRSKAHEISMLRMEKTSKSTIIVLLLIGLGLLVMVVIVWNQIWKNRRKAYLLKNEKLGLQNNLKALKIKTQENHITEYALDFTKNLEYERNVINRLQQIAGNSESAVLPELRSLVAELRQKFLIDKRADELIRTSEDVLGQFYHTLLKNHPNLNKSEVQLCNLIRLELSNKEIALIRNVTPESIKIFKNRLKRKLNVSATESLNDYLKSIAILEGQFDS